MTEGSLRSLVDRNSDRKNRTTDSKVDEESEYQAFAFGRVGPRPQIMIEICKADGFRLVLPYIDLKAITSMNPDTTFELQFTSQKIAIEGRHLRECYRYIKQNRLESVVEASRETAMSLDEKEPVISSVRIANLSTKT